MQDGSPSTRPARGRALYVAVALLAAAGPALYWDGGMLERETIAFVANYTADRPVLHKVFDPTANDHSTYQARELSYFFDYVDATVYAALTAPRDPSLLVPLTAVATPLLLMLVLARGVARTARAIDPLTAALAFAAIASSFVLVSTLGVFYRAGKPLLAPLVLAFLFHVWHVHRARARTGSAPADRRMRDGLIACALAVAAGLLDRQGVFYVLVACGVLLVHVATTRQLKDLLVWTGAALVLLQIYNFLLAPFIIRQLNGYSPSFSYQRIPPERLAELPALALSAAVLLAENVVVMLGGAWWITLPLLGVFAVAGLRAARARNPAGAATPVWSGAAGRAWGYVLLVAVGHVVMFALMIARHPWVSEAVDHRYWYYTCPFAAVLLFGLVVALDAVLPALGRGGRRLLQAGLLAIVVSNIASLPAYERLMRSGEWYGPVFEQSDLLKVALRQGAPEPGLADEYRAFFEFASARHQPRR